MLINIIYCYLFLFFSIELIETELFGDDVVTVTAS